MFTENQQYRILNPIGYTGPVNQDSMNQFVASNPAAANKMNMFKAAAGGLIKNRMQEGGLAQVVPKVAPKDPGQWSIKDYNYNADGTMAARIQNSKTGEVVDFTHLGLRYSSVPEATAAAESDIQNRNKAYTTYLQNKEIYDKSFKEESDKAAKESAEYAATITRDIPAAAKAAQDKINTLNLEISQLQSQDQSNPAIAAQVKTKQEALVKAQQEATNIGSIRASDVTEDAKKLSASVMADPGSVIQREKVATIDPTTTGTIVDPTVGQITAPTPQTGDALKATATTAVDPIAIAASTIEDVSKVSGKTGEMLEGISPAETTIPQEEQVTAATMDPTTTAVKDITAAQGNAILMNNPVQRKIEADPVTGESELISGVADAVVASEFTEQVQSATATPSDKATVKGQLDILMQDFEGGDTPTWASGAMRAANQAMISRGLGASSMAGQAIIQATMEAALPIAMADAKTQASFEAQNLSNRQARAILAAQQRASFIGIEFDQAFQARVQNAGRIADIANMNFTADQQIALENSRTVNTMNIANLTNRQAIAIAQASAISQLETQNLSNQQQEAVENSKNFLQVNMTNMSNRQQTEMFKAQAMQQSLLTDEAAENAAKQFNATSENQTKQFMTNLNSQISQFNAAQQNAISEFNAGEENAISKFNATIQEQRLQFNSANSLAIAQANAVWRQNVSTLNTAAENKANMQYAKEVNGLTDKSIDEIWQRERDIMDMYFNTQERVKDRLLELVLADKKLEATRMAQEYTENRDMTNTLLTLFFPKGLFPEGLPFP